MSEAATEQPAETTSATESAETETAATPTATEIKPTETVDFWKQKAREQEQRAKANADKAKEFDALQESQKSEQQKIADRAAEAERERDEARSEGLRYRAAIKHGVTEDHFDLLGIGDEETITARAERVGGLLKLQTENDRLTAEVEALKQGKPAPSSARPTESLKPGATAEQIRPERDDSYPSGWLPQRQ